MTRWPSHKEESVARRIRRRLHHDWPIRSCLFAASLLSIVFPVRLAGQLSTLSFDLRNNISFHRSLLETGDVNLHTYGQYYIASLGGYVLDPRLATFALETSIADNASTNSSLTELQTLRTRNLGYYNASLTLLPNNRYPLSLYASQSDMVNIDMNSVSTVGPILPPSTIHNQIMGARWNIPRNGLPQTELSAGRTKSQGGNTLVPVDQTDDLWSIRMANTNDLGSSRYVIQYTGTHTNSPTSRIDRVNNEVLFNGNASIGDRVEVTSNALYALRDLMETRRIETGWSYRQSDNLRHQIRLLHSENHFRMFTDDANLTEVGFQSTLNMSDRMHGTFNFDYGQNRTQLPAYSILNERQSLRADMGYVNRYPFAEINGSVRVDAGFESYPTAGRKFIQRSALGLGASSMSVGRFLLSVQDNAGFNTEYYFGNSLSNALHLGVTTDFVPRSTVGIEFSQNNSRYLEYAEVYPRSISTIRGNISTRLTPALAVQAEHTEMWNQTWYLERQRKTTATITASGIIPNLALQLRGESVFDNFTAQTMRIVTGSFEYRFNAFAFNGRASHINVAGYVTEEVFLEIRRPLQFDFR